MRLHRRGRGPRREHDAHAGHAGGGHIRVLPDPGLYDDFGGAPGAHHSLRQSGCPDRALHRPRIQWPGEQKHRWGLPPGVASGELRQAARGGREAARRGPERHVVRPGHAVHHQGPPRVGVPDASVDGLARQRYARCRRLRLAPRLVDPRRDGLPVEDRWLVPVPAREHGDEPGGIREALPRVHAHDSGLGVQLFQRDGHRCPRDRPREARGRRGSHAHLHVGPRLRRHSPPAPHRLPLQRAGAQGEQAASTGP
mmetsp:Transcript_60192/g.183861  ORF Transcript_60192/g.183861 Transcript_60192/m.183861 type:complete len:254 (-) Transcript_60192:531-1292(-)